MTIELNDQEIRMLSKLIDKNSYETRAWWDSDYQEMTPNAFEDRYGMTRNEYEEFNVKLEALGA